VVKNSLAANMAKWLIPSSALLFGLVGYIVQTAQEELLGLASPMGATNNYFAGASDFFRDTLVLLVDGLINLVDGRGVSFASLSGWLILASLVTAMILFGSACAKLVIREPTGRVLISRAEACATYVATAMIIVIIIWKFLLLDAPLAQVKGTILESGQLPVSGVIYDRPAEGRVTVNKPFTDRLSPRGTTIKSDKLIDQTSIPTRALSIWSAIVCSRIGQYPDFYNGLDNSGHCAADEAANQKELDGLFAVELWSTALIVALALGILKSPSSRTTRVTLAILAIGYSLALPYAYGKLKRSTYFDYGLVKLVTPLAGSYGISKDGGLYALIVSRTSAGADLLVVGRSPPCRDGQPWNQSVQLASVSASDLISVEEIYRQDVITWAMLQQRSCHRCPPENLQCQKT
jgi:hypothetical protein